MLMRLQKALLALILAFSFVLNGGAMQAAHAAKPVPASAAKMTKGAMPCGHARHAEKSHPCCPRQSDNEASCAADCCMSVIPVTLQACTEFSFVRYKPRPKPALALASRIADPPSRPPEV